MSARKIEKNEKGKLINKCNFMSDSHNEVMVGSGFCKRCGSYGGITDGFCKL